MFVLVFFALLGGSIAGAIAGESRGKKDSYQRGFGAGFQAGMAEAPRGWITKTSTKDEAASHFDFGKADIATASSCLGRVSNMWVFSGGANPQTAWAVIYCEARVVGSPRPEIKRPHDE